MSKLDRSNVEEVYVSGFLPSYTLPNKMPWSLDPFLEPLVTDLEDAFIDGKDLIYQYTKFCKYMYAYRLLTFFSLFVY